jgi:hypothetical protein
MKAWMAVVALVGAFGCGTAIADDGDGNELIKECSEAVRGADGLQINSHYDAGYCLGLTQGVRQTMRLLNEDIPPDLRTCFPDGITNGQGMRIVLKYLQDHPARLQEQAVYLVFLAYKTAYPCK